MKTKSFFIPLLSSAAIVSATHAWSCSICRCGDPTFNALGVEGVPQSGFRIAMDTDRLTKEQGSIHDGDFSEITEERITLLASFAVNDSIALFARLPYGRRDLREMHHHEDHEEEHAEEAIEEEVHLDPEFETFNTSGIADPELYAQFRLWSSPFEGDVGNRASLFAIAGVKTPWGENNIKKHGERVDEHAQPGTGSTDWFGGLAGSYLINPQSSLFGSIQYRATGENDYDYEYGDIWLANLAIERKLGNSFDAALELNYRRSDRDRHEAEFDPNTGGSIFYATPRLLYDVGNGWVLRASAQIPLSQSGLNGTQDEGVVYNMGMTYWIGQ